MKVLRLAIPDLLLIEPQVYTDARGFFYESFNQRRFADAIGNATFVQDNHSSSVKNVLRGLHYQIGQPQQKLLRVISGEIYDVAVDVRQSSPTFAQWVAVRLSAENRQQLWIPAGFAHGFLVLSERAELLYKTSDYWAPEHERCIAWDDPTLAIPWPVDGAPVLSPKDREGSLLKNAELFP